MEIVDDTEVRSEDLNVRVGEKRAGSSEDDVEVRAAKKARNGGEVRGNLKRVAEIVLALETLGKMRGGRSPTQAEVEMMSEARGKLAEVCREFKPKDVFPREAFGVVIDDLGLSKMNEQMLGFRATNVPIAQKLKLTQEKMGKSEEFAVQSASYSSQKLQTNVGAASESGSSHAVRMLTSQKPSQASTASVGLQSASQSARVSAPNSTALPYQLPTSEVRPPVLGETPSSHVGRDSSSLALPRADRPHFSSDMKYNGAYTSQVQVNSSGNHSRPLSWSVQPLQSTLSVKNAADSNALINASKKVEGAAEMSRVIPQVSKSITSQTTSVNPQHILHGTEPGHALSLKSKHTDIANLVQKLLQPTLHERPVWAPPSRDYMNKSLACQLCKLISLEVDNVLVCDGCEKGYHLKCLKINNQKSIPRGEWHCAKCLSLSNGKALPPKYGRVLRNAITAPKASSNATTVHMPLEKKLGAAVRKVAGNEKSGIQDAPGGTMDNNINSFAAGTEMTDKRVMHKEIDDKSSGPVSTDMIKTSADSCIKSVGLSVETSNDKKLIAQSASYPPADPQTIKNISSNSINPSTNFPGMNFKVKDLHKSGSETNDEVKRDEQGTLHANHVEVSETILGPNEHDVTLSDGLHQVDWIGDILNVVEEKTYYQSCSINGVVYKVHDHALFRLQSNILTPFKLQSMWEDSKTRSMWIVASRCYFPADLPKAVGRPFAPDNNEVYESNHDTALWAGLIEGPCKVLSPRLFAEESQRKTRLGMEASGGLQPLFVCKWFFDERKGLFRDVTS